MSHPMPGPYRAAPRPPMRPLPPPVSPSQSATRGVGRDDFVSGEAVALDLPPANLGLRVLSGFIDVTIGWLLFWLWFLYLMPQLNQIVHLDGALRTGLGTAWTILVFLLIPTVVETVTRGKTLGHLILGIRTVNDGAGPITVRQAFGRALVGMPELYFFGGIPALVTAAINPKCKRLGDLVAGTYVIRDRASAPPSRHIAMPPELAEWATSADFAPMPPTLATGIRGFLDRYDTFTPQARAVTGQQLVLRAVGYVAPPPPPTAPPERVLAAIAAERYRRDAARIARNQKLAAALFSR